MVELADRIHVRFLAALTVSALATAGLVGAATLHARQNDPARKEWLQLFNGRNLT